MISKQEVINIMAIVFFFVALTGFYVGMLAQVTEQNVLKRRTFLLAGLLALLTIGSCALLNFVWMSLPDYPVAR